MTTQPPPRILTRAVLAVVLLTFSACEKTPPAAAAPPTPAAPKPATADLVMPDARSQHFAAVNRQLELGGTLYGYMDVDGDVTKLADAVKSAAASLPNLPAPVTAFLQQDHTQLLQTLGLGDVKAIGVSSVADKTDGGFNNRLFIYTPEGRHGLLAALGGEPAAFTNAKLAPANADLYAESEIDLPALYAVVKDVAGQIAGAQMVAQIEAGLQTGSDEVGVSPLDVIKSLKGRIVMVGRLDEKDTMTVPLAPPLVVPAVSGLLRIDGLGAAIGPALGKVETFFDVSTVGSMKIYTLKIPLPVEGLRPVLAIEESALYVATTPEFLTECHDHKAGLDQDPVFQQAVTAMGGKGNSLTYLSPRLFDRLRQIPALNPKMDPVMAGQLAVLLQQLPALKRPMVEVSANLPDGILTRSYSNASFKQVLAMGPVMMVGMMSALTKGMETAGVLPGQGQSGPSARAGAAGGAGGLQLNIGPGGTIRPVTRQPNPPGPPGSLLAQAQAIRASASDFVRTSHLPLGADLVSVENAAAAVTQAGGNATPQQIAALNTALGAAISRAHQISQRPSETAAAKAKAADLESQLQALKAAVSQPQAAPAPADAAAGTNFTKGLAALDQNDPDQAIAAFTAAIQAHESLAGAYAGRASAYDQKDDYDHALTDYNESIRLAPAVAEAYEHRGEVYVEKGDLEHALADFTEAIRLDPKNAGNFSGRAGADLGTNDFARAVADCTEAIRLQPDDGGNYLTRATAKLATGDFEGAIGDYSKSIALASATDDFGPYARFSLALVLRRLHRDEAPAGLAKAVAGLKAGWPETIGSFLTGDLPETTLLSEAAKGDAKTVREHQCEAAYYAGMARLLQGNAAAAKDCFNRCLSTKEVAFLEYTMAQAELARLVTGGTGN